EQHEDPGAERAVAGGDRAGHQRPRGHRRRVDRGTHRQPWLRCVQPRALPWSCRERETVLDRRGGPREPARRARLRRVATHRPWRHTRRARDQPPGGVSPEPSDRARDRRRRYLMNTTTYRTFGTYRLVHPRGSSIRSFRALHQDTGGPGVVKIFHGCKVSPEVGGDIGRTLGGSPSRREPVCAVQEVGLLHGEVYA